MKGTLEEVKEEEFPQPSYGGERGRSKRGVKKGVQ
jgi:hypothetical protein